jgi:hypothetical protein
LLCLWQLSYWKLYRTLTKHTYSKSTGRVSNLKKTS